MKKILLTLTIAVLSTFAASAQYNGYETPLSYTSREPAEGITSGMQYKQLKKIYNHKMYTETLYDRYAPGWAGMASFIMPGLGQMTCRETGRGFAWLGGALASSLVMSVGNTMAQSGEYYGVSDTANTGYILALIGGLSFITIDILAIVDAVRVAKVKNMYEQDLRKNHDIGLSFRPSVNTIQTADGAHPSAGFTLALNF